MASPETPLLLVEQELRALTDQLRGLEGRLTALSCCTATVKQMTDLFREQMYRQMATESQFQNLLEVLRALLHEIDVLSKDTGTLEYLDSCMLLLSECFRCLRNASVQCPRNQNMMRNLGLIDTSILLINIFEKLKTDLESLLTALRCSLQFLGNIATGNIDSQNMIWKLAFPSVFLNCLNHPDEKVVTYCCMVLFTCLNPDKMTELLEENNLDTALAVLQASRKYPNSEWAFLIVTNHLLKCPELVKAMYAKLSNQERTMFLELIQSEIGENNLVIHSEVASFFANRFKEKCQGVLNLTSAANDYDEEVLVTIQLLDVLCEATSTPEQLKCLQSCPDLLEAAIQILKLVHIAGKQATNIFTVTHSVTGQEQASHPALGFKSHLIRLIGNLCYQNKTNQDKITASGNVQRWRRHSKIQCFEYMKLQRANGKIPPISRDGTNLGFPGSKADYLSIRFMS
uniref:Ataxin 10 n=1 Tax=Salvator merianae TaxID=96440 RepID=A0A8D0BN71_SALMN